MELIATRILLRNLASRIEVQKDGSGQLVGKLTADELAALRTAIDLVDGQLTAKAQGVGESFGSARTQSRDAPLDDGELITSGDTEDSASPAPVPHRELDFGSLHSQQDPQNGRLCLDFGTAMSKATLVIDDDGTNSEEILVLRLGRPGNQEEVSETMLISSVYIDNEGRLWFGKAAVERSMHEGGDGSRGRLDNIKRRLSEEGWSEQVGELFNPTGVTVSYGDMILSYLTFLTWSANSCLSEMGYPRNLPRRFALPCLSGEKRRESVHRLRNLVGEAQILADTFGTVLQEGVSLRDFVRTLGLLRQERREYQYVLEDIVEPLGVANSMISWTTPVNSLVLVIDVGAGTSDLSLYRLNIDPERNESTGIEVEGSSRVLTEAGNHLDRLLIALIMKKSDISTDDARRWRSAYSALELRIREFKESLFQEGYVFVLLENVLEVEIELGEFIDLKAVREFGDSLRSAVVDVLESVDESWVNWIRASPQRYLTVALTGGGAVLPMVEQLAEGTIEVNGTSIVLRRALRFPEWLREVDENLEPDYPRIAVSLGGARKRLIQGSAARITGGDVMQTPKLGGFFQKGV